VENELLIGTVIFCEVGTGRTSVICTRRITEIWGFVIKTNSSNAVVLN